MDETCRVLLERLDELERECVRLRRRVDALEVRSGRFPFIIPTRTRTKIAVSVTSLFALSTFAIAASPKDVTVGNWRYESDGIPIELATTVATLAGAFITLRNHFRDKQELLARSYDQANRAYRTND